MSRSRNSGNIRIIMIFLIIIAAFWVLITNFLPQKEPELVYLNETQIETILEEPYSIAINTYDQIKLDVQKGDVLNITIEVLEGGPIDFFILEEDRVEMLIDAIEGRTNRFESYDRGKGLNITYKKTQFIIVNNKDWYLFLNNYGHVQDGARPRSRVYVRVDIKKIAYHETNGFTMPS
ncbi:MAG: hypothetical protein NWF07_05550 [Candidatus Bathyarchaeota archaeon]|nr:hypothetical protein [Candidatus Bathyarchaeota archaeon]